MPLVSPGLSNLTARTRHNAGERDAYFVLPLTFQKSQRNGKRSRVILGASSSECVVPETDFVTEESSRDVENSPNWMLNETKLHM